MPGSTPAPSHPESRSATLIMACIGAFVAYLPVTTVSVSLSAIQASLGGDTADLSWISDAFVLPMAAFILTAGAFGDVHGRKRVYQAGLALSALGALVSLCAHSVQVVWVGQAISGLGAAALLPASLALISHAVPDHRERGKFIGIWATSLLLALAIGPFIAGVLLEHTSWRWIFITPIPAGLLTLAASVRFLTDSKAPGQRQLDWPGQATATIAVVALVFGVIEGGAGSFTAAKVIIALVLAVVALVAFVLVERRSASPMLDLKLFANPGFTASVLIAMITFLSLIGAVFVLSLYFGLVQQLTTLQSATRMFMFTVAPILVGTPVGALMHRVSAKLLITAGLVVAGLATLTLIGLDADTGFWSVSVRLFVLGAALGAVITPMTATAVSSVHFSLAGMAAAGSNAFRQIGGALGPAVLGAVLTTKATHTLAEHLQAAGVSDATQSVALNAMKDGGFQAVAGANLPGSETGAVLGSVGQSFLDGMHLGMGICAVLMFLAAAIALTLLPSPARKATPAVPATAPVPAAQ